MLGVPVNGVRVGRLLRLADGDAEVWGGVRIVVDAVVSIVGETPRSRAWVKIS